MTKMTTMILASCALAGSFGGAALAADTAMSPHEVRASKIIGSAVYDRENADVASVSDIVLDKSGKIADVVLNYGATAGVGGKYVAVSFSDLKYDNNRWSVSETKDQLAAMPTYRLDEKTN